MQECAKGQTTKQDCSNLLFAPAQRLCDVFGVPAAAAASHLSARVGPVIAQGSTVFRETLLHRQTD